MIKVYCEKCREFVDEKNTKFVNIEEGFFGEDILTFVCPHCKTTQRSPRRGR